jgi:hypothetical protein
MEFCWKFQFLWRQTSRKVYSKCDVLCNLQTRKELTKCLWHLFCWKLEYLRRSVCPQNVSHWPNEFSRAQKYPIMLSFCFHSVDYAHEKNSFQALCIIWENISKTQLFYNHFCNPTKSRQFVKNSLINEIIRYQKFLLQYSKRPNISSTRTCFISHLKTAYFHIVISSKLKWLRVLEFGATI